MRFASLLTPVRTLRAYAARAEQRAVALRVDTLSAVGTAMHGVEGRLVAYLRGVESRITTAAEHREERSRAHVGERFDAVEAQMVDLRLHLGERFDVISAEIADFRARHNFIGDPVAHSPVVSEAGERLVPRRPPGVDPRLPAGRPHP